MKFVLSRRIYSVPYLFFFRSMLKLSLWGYLKVFIALSLDGVFLLLCSGVYLSVRSPFIYSFHFVCLLGKPGVCSSQFFAFFPVVIFGFSLPTSVLRRVIFVRGMLSPGPGSLIGFTGKVNAQVLRPRYPHPRWYPSYPFGCPLAL